MVVSGQLHDPAALPTTGRVSNTLLIGSCVSFIAGTHAWQRETYLTHVWNQTMVAWDPVRSPFTISTELPCIFLM
jgi:hypothetical protein